MIFGTRGRATWAGADRLPVRLGFGYRWRPAVRISQALQHVHELRLQPRPL